MKTIKVTVRTIEMALPTQMEGMWGKEWHLVTVSSCLWLAIAIPWAAEKEMATGPASSYSCCRYSYCHSCYCSCGHRRHHLYYWRRQRLPGGGLEVQGTSWFSCSIG